MKFQLINKYTKANIKAGLPVGKQNEMVVSAEPIVLFKDGKEFVTFSSENGYCADIDESDFKGVKNYFDKKFKPYFAVKVTGREPFQNENSKYITYKGHGCNVGIVDLANVIGCQFSQVATILQAVQDGRLNMEDKEVAKNVKRLLKIVCDFKPFYTGEDSNGNGIYEIASENE